MMRSNIIYACLPFILGASGFVFPLYFCVPEPNSRESVSLLSSLVTTSALFTSFTVAFLSFCLSNEGGLIHKIKKRGAFSALMRVFKRSLILFLLLLVVSVLGFSFYPQTFYANILFSLFGLAIGYFVNIFSLLIEVGYYDDKKLIEETRKNTLESYSDSNALRPESYYDEVTNMLDTAENSNTDIKKFPDEEIDKLLRKK